jgi:glucose/arabinose dehydrogenase
VDSEKEIFKSLDASFVIDTIVSGVKVPFGMDWLPDGQAIISDRTKSSQGLLILEKGKLTPLCNVPDVFSSGDGGMLDVLVHPDYRTNGWIYFSYSIMRPDSTSTLVVDRAKLNGNCLVSRQKIFEVKPFYKSDGHFGNRLLIKDGYLFIAMGGRYVPSDSAQTLTNDFGKIVRLYDDGRIPADNPFVHVPNALPEIWSYGHRNPQGMAVNPMNGELWIDEHGPKGGDEINVIRPGLNYGWPVICYGIDYDGKPIGQGITKKDGMEQPLYYYVPSIAPSGMLFYTGDKFPGWKNNLFIGALALRHINRLVLFENKVVKEERLLESKKWRVRFLKQGTDGYIYFGVDGGMILRLRPA